MEIDSVRYLSVMLSINKYQFLYHRKVKKEASQGACRSLTVTTYPDRMHY